MPPTVPGERVQHCGRAAQGTHRVYATGTVVAPNVRVLPLPRKRLWTAGNAGLGAEARGLGSLRVMGAWRTADFNSCGSLLSGRLWFAGGSGLLGQQTDVSLLLPLINVDFPMRRYSFW